MSMFSSEKSTAKIFALQIGALLSLYVVLGFLISLLFSVITIMFPAEADSFYTYESASETIRLSIATVFVFFPTYLVLTRIFNKQRRSEAGEYITITKWLVYLSFLVGGAVLLGDAVSVIYGFLNGDLTIRFLLKALVLAVIVAFALFYYIMDIRGYWVKHEQRSWISAAFAILIVIVSLALGFKNIEPPAEVREMRIDENQIQDLQSMQYRIEEYYRQEGALPGDLSEVFPNNNIPNAPEGREPYTYSVTGDKTYELCAGFAEESKESKYSIAVPSPSLNYDWSHPAGDHCFERKIIVEKAGNAVRPTLID